MSTNYVKSTCPHNIEKKIYSETETMSDLNITRFEVTGLYGIDIAHLLEKESVEHFNSIRGNKEWLSKFKEKAPVSSGTLDLAKSSYAKTDSSIRNIFSNYYLNNLMPLVFQLNKKDINDLFYIEILSISISRNGAITIKIKSSKSNSGIKSKIEQVIDVYYKYKENINNKVLSHLSNFIELFNDFFNNYNNKIKFKKKMDDNLEQYISYYEIVDFDYDKTKMKKNTIKSMYDNELYLKSLVALFKMTRTDFSNYDISKISDIKNNDYGDRVDELWAINQDRLLRHHPEAKTKENIENFFLDIILGIEILLQQKIALQYLNQWIGKQNIELRKIINSSKNVFKSKKNVFSFLKNIKNVFKRNLSVKSKLDYLIFEIVNTYVNIYDIISDNSMMQVNTNHTFFDLIMEKSIDKMRLKDILCSNKDMISDLFSLLTSISSRRTNKVVLILTIIMAFTGFLQLAKQFLNPG